MARVKGTILLPMVKALRVSAAEAKALLPPELHHYLEQRIIVSSWYEEEDHVALLKVLKRVTGLKSTVPLGHALAQFELGGIYRAALHDRDAYRTLRSFGTLWPQHHDTGQLEVARCSGGATLTLTGYAIVAREICEIITGYLEQGLTMCGCKPTSVTHSACRVTKAPTCIWRVELSPA